MDEETKVRVPIRLAHLQLLPLITGVQKVTLDELSLLTDTEFESVILCKEAGALTEAAQKLGYSSYFIPALVRPISPVKDITAAIQLFRKLKGLSLDILHTHSSKTGILGRIAGRLSGVPVIIHTVHGYAFPYSSSRFIRFIYLLMEYLGGKLCDALIVLNETDRTIAIEKLNVPERKVYLIPNGIDIESFTKADNAQRIEIRRNSFSIFDDNIVCVGMIGRLWRQKNPVCLLRAALRVLKQTDKQVQFFFIGDGELRSDLEQIISKYDLHSQIKIMGWRQDVAELLSGLDIFVLPSRWEGMPLAILEAMASSLPVIVSDIAGNRDIISHNKDGFLFDSDNDEQLSERILSLVNDSDKRKVFGLNARNKIIEHYRIEDRVEKMTKLYISLLISKRTKLINMIHEK